MNWRTELDNAIRTLWCAFRDASDDHGKDLTQADLDLWGLVTRHSAIQDRLAIALAAKKAEETGGA